MSTPTESLASATQPLFDAMAQIFALYGWPEVAGRLYATLFLARRPLSLDELSERQGVSKATVSTSLRMLETLHLAHRVQAPATTSGGGRPKLYYRAESNLMKTVQELILHNARRESELADRGIAETRLRLSTLIAETEDPDMAAQAQSYLDALQSFDGWLKWGNRVLWLVESVERMSRFIKSNDQSDSHDSPSLRASGEQQ